ncbi:MAG: hypothetical protein WDM92_11245 [Caulobacteraceae bacterium]
MIRRLGPAVIFLVGLAAAAVLAVHAGLGAILRSIAEIGWGRLAAICALQLGSLALCAWAWRLVAGRAGFLACALSRWIRDGASNLVGFIPAIARPSPAAPWPCSAPPAPGRPPPARWWTWRSRPWPRRSTPSSACSCC